MKWPKDKLTRFEVARIIGARSLQITLGAPILVKTKNINSIDIAKEEFLNNLIPMTIKRKYPNREESIIKMNSAIKRWIEEEKDQI